MTMAQARSSGGKRDFGFQRRRGRNGASNELAGPQRLSTRRLRRQFAPFLPTVGKSPPLANCVVADAVAIEPVSQPKIPDMREFAGNFACGRHLWLHNERKTPLRSLTYAYFP